MSIPTNNRARTLADLKVTVERGTLYTDGRNGLVAYAVIVEKVTQASIAASIGLDTGDVSRVVGYAKKSPAALDALKSLKRDGSQTARIAAAAEIGAAYLRRPARVAPVKSAPKVGKSGGTDTGSRNPATGPLSGEGAPVESPQSARDILAALAVLRDAARAVKWNDDESADLASIALQFSDIAAE